MVDEIWQCGFGFHLEGRCEEDKNEDAEDAVLWPPHLQDKEELQKRQCGAFHSTIAWDDVTELHPTCKMQSFVERWGSLFDDFRHPCYYFMVVEVPVS